MKCLCGYELKGSGRDQLVDEVATHCQTDHPYLGLGRGHFEDFVDAGLRQTPWNGELQKLPSLLLMKPLSPDLAGDFIRFFDHDAFIDSPAMASCYCNAQYFGGDEDEWRTRRAERNRDDMESRIRAGQASGILAYSEKKVIGWCNAGPRELFLGLARHPELELKPELGVGSVVCFVVSPPYRGQQLTGLLLDAACDLLRQRGLTMAEGYPYAEPQPMGMGDFLGSPGLFLSHGFHQERAAGKFLIMRRKLTSN